MIAQLSAALRRLAHGDPAAARLLGPAARPSWPFGTLAAILAFFAVLALALALAAGELARDWTGEAGNGATLQIIGDPGGMEDQARAALEVLRTTPGVLSVRMIDVEEQRALLEPWIGAGAAMDGVPLPLLIAIEVDRAAFDGGALAARLAADAPGAVFDDHAAWRVPLVTEAEGLRVFAWAALGLIALAFLAASTLATRAAANAGGRDIRTLLRVGAHDRFIAGAFKHRFSRAALIGAVLGTAAGTGLVALLPASGEAGFFLIGIGLEGRELALPLAVPVAALVIARAATARAVRRALRSTG